MKIHIDLTALSSSIDGLERIRGELMSLADALRRIGKTLPQDTMQAYAARLEQAAADAACDGDTAAQMQRVLDETILKYRRVIGDSQNVLDDLIGKRLGNCAGVLCSPLLSGALKQVDVGRIRDRLIAGIALQACFTMDAEDASSTHAMLDDMRSFLPVTVGEGRDEEWARVCRRLQMADITREAGTDCLRRSGAYEPSWLVERTDGNRFIERSVASYKANVDAYMNAQREIGEDPTLKGILHALDAEMPEMEPGMKTSPNLQGDRNWHPFQGIDGRAFADDGHPVITQVELDTLSGGTGWKLLAPSDMRIEPIHHHLFDLNQDDRTKCYWVHR